MDLCVTCRKRKPYHSFSLLCLRCLADIHGIFEERCKKLGLGEMVPLEDKLRH